MSYEIVIPIDQLNSIIKNFEGASDYFDIQARKTMTESMMILERICKDTSPVNIGILRSSIASKIVGRALDLIGTIFSPMSYAIIMEVGRRPGTWPNIDAITRWVERKRLATSSEEIMKLGFVISRSIKNRGIQGREFFENALLSAEDFIYKKFEWMCDEFIRSFSK